MNRLFGKSKKKQLFPTKPAPTPAKPAAPADSPAGETHAEGSEGVVFDSQSTNGFMEMIQSNLMTHFDKVTNDSGEVAFEPQKQSPDSFDEKIFEIGKLTENTTTKQPACPPQATTPPGTPLVPQPKCLKRTREPPLLAVKNPPPTQNTEPPGASSTEPPTSPHTTLHPNPKEHPKALQSEHPTAQPVVNTPLLSAIKQQPKIINSHASFDRIKQLINNPIKTSPQQKPRAPTNRDKNHLTDTHIDPQTSFGIEKCAQPHPDHLHDNSTLQTNPQVSAPARSVITTKTFSVKKMAMPSVTFLRPKLGSLKPISVQTNTNLRVPSATLTRPPKQPTPRQSRDSASPQTKPVSLTTPPQKPPVQGFIRTSQTIQPPHVVSPLPQHVPCPSPQHAKGEPQQTTKQPCLSHSPQPTLEMNPFSAVPTPQTESSSVSTSHGNQDSTELSIQQNTSSLQEQLKQDPLENKHLPTRSPSSLDNDWERRILSINLPLLHQNTSQLEYMKKIHTVLQMVNYAQKNAAMLSSAIVTLPPKRSHSAGLSIETLDALDNKLDLYAALLGRVTQQSQHQQKLFSEFINARKSTMQFVRQQIEVEVQKIKAILAKQATPTSQDPTTSD